MPEPLYTDAGATFDADRVYRYRLWREWNAALPRVAFLMLNPSTADETQLDPTLRRCLGFAQTWGCGSFEIGNIFALRSTDPRAVYAHLEPVGPENDRELVAIAERATFGVVAGWGAHGKLRNRAYDVTKLITRAGRDLLCLKETVCGAPGHPLYLPRELRPRTFRRAAVTT